MASIGASLGPLDPPKTLIFLRFFNVFGIGPSSLQFRLTCLTLRHHGPSWGHLGTLLGPLGAILGPSWASLGPPWALLGPLWCHHGAIVGPSWLILGPSGATLGPPWCRQGPCWSLLGPTWSLLGVSWRLLGAFLVHVGSTSGPSWVHPLLLRSNICGLLAPFS